MSCEYSVGYEVVKMSESRVANRSGLRATSIVGHITTRIVFHLCALITSDLDPKLLFIEIFIGGVQTPPCGSLNLQSNSARFVSKVILKS